MASAANIQGEEAMPNIHTPKAADVIVVGAGATGGTAAKVLSERGLEVVLFDRGPWLKPKDYSGDEIKYINRNFLWPDPKLKPRTVRADEKTDFQRASGGDLLDQRLGDVDALARNSSRKPNRRPAPMSEARRRPARRNPQLGTCTGASRHRFQRPNIGSRRRGTPHPEAIA
jgi:choline dehydrogenase-like flavoprotein